MFASDNDKLARIKGNDGKNSPGARTHATRPRGLSTESDRVSVSDVSTAR
jgi:hypothetical protein